MAELKKCPFCGGKARTFQNDPLHKNDKIFYVYGVLCDIEDAVEAWNRRTNHENEHKI